MKMRATQRFAAAVLVVLLLWTINQVCFVRSEWKESSAIPPVAYDRTTWRIAPESAQPSLQRLTPSTGRRRPSISDLAPSRNKDIGPVQIIIDDVSRAKVAATDRVVVVGKRKEENTDWVIDELPEYAHLLPCSFDPHQTTKVYTY